MTDDDALICANPQCEHTDTQHDERTGICMAKDCRCVCFRMDWEDDGFDEDDDDIEPLDFDHYEDGAA